jgi:hypothetical protein
MTPEQQRIAIAEACGWQFDHIRLGSMYYIPEKDIHMGNPISDLNAMHEAVASKFNGPAPDGWAFIDNLRIACEIPHSHTCMALVCATAAQRAEAFLKTLNLWTP